MPEKRKAALPDYSVYHLKKEEVLRLCAEYSALDLAVSVLFYRSWAAFVILMAGFPVFYRERLRNMKQERFSRMRREFLDGMQFAGTALQTGYAMENAFREALKELRKIYSEDSFIVTEFQRIVVQTGMNVPLEELLESLGRRSHVEEIRNFSDVFLTARKTGGDMISIVRNTIANMRQKEETRLEIETVLAGKKMEQRIMSVIPLVLLGYVSLTGSDFLKGMYHTFPGACVMSACLLLYLLAFWWGKRIMDIQV